MPHLPESSSDSDRPAEPDSEDALWEPRHGLVTRVIVWLILVGFGLTVLAMIAIIFLG